MNESDMEDGEGKIANYKLVTVFPDQSPSYARGFEAGAIWNRMRSGREDVIETTIHMDNVLTVERMCTAEGWDWKMKPYDAPSEMWYEIKLVKFKSSPNMTNPHGLRVVK